MRAALVLSIAAVGLIACTSDRGLEQATEACQSVGVTAQDPQYANCIAGYRQTYREAMLRKHIKDSNDLTKASSVKFFYNGNVYNRTP